MVLLRRVIGDALRARRQSQHRTLREVSTAANVSLGYLSEIERGQKEASSELLSAICEALGAAQSEVLRAASDTLELEERMDRSAVVDGVAVLADGVSLLTGPVESLAGSAESLAGSVESLAGAVEDVSVVADGRVSVAVRRSGPLKTTLRATRSSTGPRGSHGRRVVRAA